MAEERKVAISVPETIAAKLDLILLIRRVNINSLTVGLYEQYINDFAASNIKPEEGVSIPTNTLPGTADKKIPITMEMIEVAYEVAKKVYAGNLTRTEGKRRISESTGMREGSAQDYITDFLAMMDGAEYHRTMSAEATEFFLRKIYGDYGAEKAGMAIEATDKHLKYYYTVSGSASPKRARILESLKKEFGI